MIPATLLRPCSAEDLPGKYVVRLPTGDTAFLAPDQIVMGSAVVTVLPDVTETPTVAAVTMIQGGETVLLASRQADGSIRMTDAGRGLEPMLHRCFGEPNRALSDAVFAYHDALASCANDPAAMASFCTAQGDTLDSLYERMIAEAGGIAA